MKTSGSPERCVEIIAKSDITGIMNFAVTIIVLQSLLEAVKMKT